jgi:RNA polymerase sigma factor (sigma-70 family)
MLVEPRKAQVRAAEFPDTSWTLLERAREDCAEGLCAREIFIERYSGPVEQFLRVIVRDGDTARDLSQEFFSRLSEPARGVLQRAEREKGAFRRYLQQCLRNLARDYYRQQRKEVLRGGGGTDHVPWETVGVSLVPQADGAFHQAWVRMVLSDVLKQVRDLCRRRKQEMHFELFTARYLEDEARPISWEELGARHGVDQRVARERAATVSRHFRLILRKTLRDSIMVPGGRRATDREIDGEIKALLSPLRD